LLILLDRRRAVALSSVVLCGLSGSVWAEALSGGDRQRLIAELTAKFADARIREGKLADDRERE